MAESFHRKPTDRVVISAYSKTASGRFLAERFGDHLNHSINPREVATTPTQIMLDCSCGLQLALSHANAKAFARVMGHAEEPIPVGSTIEAITVEIEDAVLIGQQARSAEQTREEALKETRQALERFLAAFMANGGKLRGVVEDLDWRINNQGRLTFTGSADDLLALWQEMPTILEAHTEQAQTTVIECKRQTRLAGTLTREIRAAQALLQTEAPADVKAEIARRIVSNPDMQDALEAAEATGEPGATKKFIADQAGSTVHEAPMTEPEMSPRSTPYLSYLDQECVSDE